MLELFGLDLKTIMIAVIIYGIIITAVNALLAFQKIRECLNRTYMGAIDVITGLAILTVWNHLFRDSEYISSTHFWIVAVWLILIIILGFVNVLAGMMSCDASK